VVVVVVVGVTVFFDFAMMLSRCIVGDIAP
jgi:hypothetical protein